MRACVSERATKSVLAEAGFALQLQKEGMVQVPRPTQSLSQCTKASATQHSRHVRSRLLGAAALVCMLHSPCAGRLLALRLSRLTCTCSTVAL